MSTVEQPETPSVFGTPAADESAGTSADRDQARKRLEKKSKFRGDLAAYVVINALLIVIWHIPGSPAVDIFPRQSFELPALGMLDMMDKARFNICFPS